MKCKNIGAFILSSDSLWASIYYSSAEQNFQVELLVQRLLSLSPRFFQDRKAFRSD
jgi:hypothetical protein